MGNRAGSTKGACDTPPQFFRQMNGIAPKPQIAAKIKNGRPPRTISRGAAVLTSPKPAFVQRRLPGDSCKCSRMWRSASKNSSTSV